MMVYIHIGNIPITLTKEDQRWTCSQRSLSKENSGEYKVKHSSRKGVKITPEYELLTLRMFLTRSMKGGEELRGVKISLW